MFLTPCVGWRRDIFFDKNPDHCLHRLIDLFEREIFLRREKHHKSQLGFRTFQLPVEPVFAQTPGFPHFSLEAVAGDG